MRVTMIKKTLTDGSACTKCWEAEDRLRRMNLWDRIDRVLTIDADTPGGEGRALAERLGIDRAPFFVVEDEDGETVYQSVMLLIRRRLQEEPAAPSSQPDPAAISASLAKSTPGEIVTWALKRYGADCTLAFSGAEDVAVLAMAAQTGLPFSIFVLDTGRLHEETLAFIEHVRTHYNAPIERIAPDPTDLAQFEAEKGLFSFYDDGHEECCALRKVAPLRRVLSQKRAWITGLRADQSPDTRTAVPIVQLDPTFEGRDGALLKVNPLIHWSSEEVWAYLTENEVPTNPLHAQGFRSIGCEPCTRAVRPDQHEREGRWWWEDTTKKECGLHLAQDAPEE
jgi:phosphoadenosine phosphosulfate reductase